MSGKIIGRVGHGTARCAAAGHQIGTGGAALLAGVLLAATPFASGNAWAANCTASDTATLAGCITSAATTITLTSNITLTADLPAVQNNTTINGAGFTVNGNNQFRGFFVGAFSGSTQVPVTVTVANISIQNAVAQGGSATGGDGGGGGAGLGGAIFVANGANVTVSNVTLSGNAAKGGNGDSGAGSGGGGGGGMGGNGARTGGNGGGGGGGLGIGASGGSGGNGFAGIATGASSGGNGGLSGGLGGANGGGGGGGGTSGGGGGGGVGGVSGSGSNGGSGGFGGGGGAGGGSGTGGVGGFGGGGGAANPIAPGGGAGAGMGGAIFVQSGGNLTLAGTLTVNGNTVTGGSAQNGGGNGSAFGSGFFLQGASGTLAFQPGSGQTQRIAGSITDQTGSGGTGGNAGSWALNVSGGGTLVLDGTNTYSGGTTVTNATLVVNGSIGDPTIGSGGLLSGTGSVGPTQINAGGTFAPGNGTPGSSMTITGNLAFQSGALYAVYLNPTTSSFASVTGTATLGGATVNAVFANGSYINKTYTILTASGGVSGTFAPTVANSNLPANFATSLSYDATHAYLDLSLNFTPGPTAPNFGSGLSGNQQAAANALINFFNTTGGIPMVFGSLTPTGLTQISGETATGSQQTTFDAMSQFMGLLTDPFMNRGGGLGGSSPSSGYAEEASAYAATKRTDAFAMFTKAPSAYEPRWSVWTSGFGGSQSTSGNAIVASNNTTSSVAGTAVGADYLISPNTIAGFALAGGGTSFSVASGGTGHSDLFQAGAYVRHTEGPAYVSAALAYGWQDITTNRTVTAAGFDQLHAEFDANAYSGRAEGGYRFVSPATFGIGMTPYAAAQFVTFDLPAYAEQAIVGTNNFVLTYGAKDVTDVRSELGFRTDKSWAIQGAILTLRGRFAWAHDFDPDRSIAATFQTLPGASFTVNGAAQAHDSALTTASVEMKWINGWSAAATFEGEFSNVTSSYAGKGVVRYTW